MTEIVAAHLERVAKELSEQIIDALPGLGDTTWLAERVAKIKPLIEKAIQAAEFATEKDCLAVVQKAYYEAYAKSDRLNMRVCAAIEKHMKESQGEPHLAAALAACAREEHKLVCPRCIPRLRCIGYPDCDGDLVGEEHSKKCLAIGVMTLPCQRLRALERAVGEKPSLDPQGGQHDS